MDDRHPESHTLAGGGAHRHAFGQGCGLAGRGWLHGQGRQQAIGVDRLAATHLVLALVADRKERRRGRALGQLGKDLRGAVVADVLDDDRGDAVRAHPPDRLRGVLGQRL